MIHRRRGVIKSVTWISPEVWEAQVSIEGQGEEAKALGYRELVGDGQPGMEVILNTTAVDLGLGTGGYHFVMAVDSSPDPVPDRPGHIMKLRYTPCQLPVLSVEEEDSPHHHEFTTWRTLEDMPVVVGTLHSMLAPVVTVIKGGAPKTRIAYIMTDGAALPLAFSRTVRELQERGDLAATITYGHAWGGDYEAINVFSALIAAKYVAKADVAVVLMGPGVVGTGTLLGTTALEQAAIIDAVSLLEGRPIAIPRMSWADPRERHRGMSHHTLTALGRLTHHRCELALPQLPEPQLTQLKAQVAEADLDRLHRLHWVDVTEPMVRLRQSELTFSTMGRGLG